VDDSSHRVDVTVPQTAPFARLQLVATEFVRLKGRQRRVGKINRFKRVALRCEKTARNVSSIVALALVCIIVKSIHRPWPEQFPTGWRTPMADLFDGASVGGNGALIAARRLTVRVCPISSDAQRPPSTFFSCRLHVADKATTRQRTASRWPSTPHPSGASASGNLLGEARC
jgi:hypothetical protein